MSFRGGWMSIRIKTGLSVVAEVTPGIVICLSEMLVGYWVSGRSFSGN